MHTLAHDYVLLCLDDHTGTPLVRHEMRNLAAVAGGWLASLQFEGLLIPVEAHRFGLRPGPVPEEAQWLADLLPDRPLPIKTLVGRLSMSRRLWMRTVGDLIDRGILAEERDKVMFVTWRRRQPTANLTVENQLRERLWHHVRTVDREAEPSPDDALLSLLRATELLDEVAPATLLASHRDVILERTERVPIGRDVRETADAMDALVAVSHIVT